MEPNPEPVTLVDVGRSGTPGCLTVTAIDATGDDAAQIDEFVGKIMSGLVEQPGYLGTLFASTNRGRHFTVSVWENVEAVEGLRRTAHGEAMRAFFKDAVGTRVMTSVWTPHRMNDIWIRPPGDGRPERGDPAESPWL